MNPTPKIYEETIVELHPVRVVDEANYLRYRKIWCYTITTNKMSGNYSQIIIVRRREPIPVIIKYKNNKW